jgi:hypothetical protein
MKIYGWVIKVVCVTGQFNCPRCNAHIQFPTSSRTPGPHFAALVPTDADLSGEPIALVAAAKLLGLGITIHKLQCTHKSELFLLASAHTLRIMTHDMIDI